ncbi:MAG TPA: hypothetical protein VGR26_07340 [Acidimicrobiales bacterium]|nr:hypothetical protein [Acidimicrobiales bacterium]
MGPAAWADDDRPLEERLLALTDDDGTLGSMVAGMRALVRSPLGRLAMKRFLRVDPEEMAAHVDDFDSLLGVAAEGIRQFTALGWAPSGLTPVTGVKAALAQLAETGSVDDAEQVLADAWDDVLKPAATLVSRVGTLGLPSEPYNAVFQERRRLLFKAWEHHRAGAYEASIPIVYAQVEGICFDVTDKPFFSTREDRKVQPVDDETLAGLHEALPVARDWFSAGLHHTSLSPDDGSRHGVMHGRALRYDSRLLSVKAFALLLAVMEWARPIAAQLGEWFEAEEFARHAGSHATDENGRMLDRREFRETQRALRWLSTCQTGWYRNRGGRFRPELLATVAPALSSEHGLPPEHGVEMRVDDDGHAWWAWRVTPSGLVLGVGASASAPGPKYPGEVPMEWTYEGNRPPAGPPGEDAAWGEGPFEFKANW